MAKKRKPTWMAALLIVSVIPALALLKTTVFSNNRNILGADNSTKYDIVVDLGEGGRFESGDFSKMPNGKWISKYLPGKNPVTLPKPVKDGYIFEGWLTEGSSIPKPDYVIPPWSRENINLTAKWKSAESVLLPGPQFNEKVKAMPNFSNVTEIRFIRGTPKPDGIDLSEAQNGAIRGFIEGNVLNIASDGQIFANPDCWKLFSYYGNIVTIKLDNFNTEKVTDMHWMFDGCQKLKAIDLSNFNTSNVENMSCMFGWCKALTTLDLTSFDASKVTDITQMFTYCENLTSINLSQFNTDIVEYAGDAFSHCLKLTKIDAPQLDLNKCTNFARTFNTCPSLTSIRFKNPLQLSNVTSALYMFNGCSKLSGELTVVGNVDNYREMFTGCSSDANAEFWVDYKDAQTKVVAQNIVNTKNSGDHVYLKIPPSTLVDGRTFNHAVKSMPSYNGISHIVFEKGLPQNATSYEHIDVSLNQDKSIIAYKVGDTLHVGCEGVIYANENCRQMFRSYLMPSDPPGTPGGTGFINLKSLNLNNFNTSKTQNMSYMFSGLTQITNLDVSMLDTSNVTNMASMFDRCKSLTSIDVSNFDTSKVVDMGSMFSELPITSINLKNFNTENVTNMLGMFWKCANLQTLDLSNFNTKKVTSLTYFAEGCENLVDLNLSSFDFSNVTDFWATFNRCFKLRDIHTVIPIRNDAACMYMFEECNSLNLTLIIDCSGMTKYEEMLLNCSTKSGTRTVVNYTNAASKRMAQTLVNTRGSNSNVVLGRQVTIPAGKAKSFNSTSSANSSHTPSPNPSQNTSHTITLNNGPAAQYPKQVLTVQNNTIPNLAIPELNPRYAGHFGGYYYDQQFTKPVRAGDVVTEDITIYARW